MHLRIALAALALTSAAFAQSHPDLQGIWTNATLTPLERPAQFAGKPTITIDEARSLAAQDLQRLNADRRDGGAQTDVGRAYNNLFYDRGTQLASINGVIRTSLIVDPPDGQIPALTPQAQKRLEQTREYAREHPADRAQDRGLTERCLLWQTAGPPMMPGPYNNNYQIVQTPGSVMILSEMIHDARIIPLDGRPHLPSSVRQWMGDSRGHWEGSTLVVDTTNFSDNTHFRGADRNLHLVERFTRLDPNTLLYRFTVDDPGTFTRAWTAEIPMRRTAGPIYEYACHEGNMALPDILAGARAQEAAAKK
ncbi:MAG: hypothetical protein ACRD30_07745 [Bryobacteraceae bacterium]